MPHDTIAGKLYLDTKQPLMCLAYMQAQAYKVVTGTNRTPSTAEDNKYLKGYLMKKKFLC